MATKSHYPTPDYVSGIYHYRTVGNYEKMKEYFSKDFISETTGNHALSGSGGLDHAASQAKKLDDLLEPAKGSKVEVVRVIGGETQAWCCIDLKTTGTTKAGELSLLLRIGLLLSRQAFVWGWYRYFEVD